MLTTTPSLVLEATDQRAALLRKLDDAVRAVEQLKEPRGLRFLEEGAKLLADVFQRGGKVLLAGNGGSLCDAAHFAEEWTGFFARKRRPLPALVLADPGHMSCTGNDVGFEWVFARGVEAFGKPGDLFIGLSTSGKSPNIVRAFEKAREGGLHTMALLGKDGGLLKGVADFELLIEGFATSERIQEAHMVAMHLLIDLVEEQLFEAGVLP